jgi:membrane-associated phospholipid phosphatase
MPGMPHRSWFAGLLIAGLVQPVQAQTDTRRTEPPARSEAEFTAPKPTPLFHRSDLLMAGGVLAATGLLMPLDRGITQGFLGDGPQGSATLHHSAKFFNTIGDPGATIASLGLWGIGLVTGSGTLKDVGGHATLAIAASGLATGLIKGIAGRQRPRVNPGDADEFAVGQGFKSGGRTSFPSGHTTAAFAFATVMNAELRRIAPGPARFLGPLLFTSAAGVGLARVYDSKHWASDVVLGAGIGTFTGLVVTRWAHHEDQASSATVEPASLVPEIGVATGGVSVAWRIPLR